MKVIVTGLLFLVLSMVSFVPTYGQKVDTVKLETVSVVSSFNERPLLRIPSSLSIIDSIQFSRQQGTSLIPVMNTLPGVRMEERSPGSYRLSVRGSLLRSPFGIRNVKVYLDEFPLTDAGGNTYLNLIDVNSINRLEVLKGPDGSLYGANSGGVVNLGTFDRRKFQLTGNASIGTLGLVQQHLALELPIAIKLPDATNYLSVFQGTHHLDGYRENSSLKRDFFQLTNRFNYKTGATLRVLVFYSNLKYQTPGGLTLEQWHDNPRAARPPTITLPGAIEQDAGVHNKTLFGGIFHEVQLGKSIRHGISVFGSTSDFTNRFITNYEVRDERSKGIRTYIRATNNREGLINLTVNLGLETQQTNSNIANYGNNRGSRDTVQVSDNLSAIQSFMFARLSIDFYNKLVIEASSSINFNKYEIEGIEPVYVSEFKRVFKPQVMPRLAVSYPITNNLAWRASVSKGYSPPTFNEIRSSDNIINSSLQPETGWNYETGYRMHYVNRFWWDVSVFYYKLEKAIVRRTNEVGAEYFTNAGGIDQPGLESQMTVELVKSNGNDLLRQLQLTSSYTYNDFKFGYYSIDTIAYNGNSVTGIPKQLMVTGLNIILKGGFFAFAQHSYTSAVPLNDANNVHADAYNLVYIKTGWEFKTRHQVSIRLYLAIDNLFNTKYSSGNDINAAGARYYNPAPPKNYHIGLSVRY